MSKHAVFAGLQTLGVGLRGNGAKRNDLASRNPEPPLGGEAYTVCYMTFAPIDTASIVNNLTKRIDSAKWIATVGKHGNVTLTRGAVKGNKAYAYRNGKLFPIFHIIFSFFLFAAKPHIRTNGI
jgi:hypothetical protein